MQHIETNNQPSDVSATATALTLNKDIQKKDLWLVKQIGRGTFAEVFYATWKGKAVAVKKLFKTDYTALEKEAELMNQVSHSEFFVNPLGLCQDPISLVMEYQAGGNLFKFLHRTNQPLDSTECYRIASDIANGLTLLHAQHILHLDFKSANILLTKDKRGKICDFGSAVDTANFKIKLHYQTAFPCGTPQWASPESHYSLVYYTDKSDVYSLAIILYEIFTRREPFEDMPQLDLILAIFNGERPDVSKVTPQKLAGLITFGWKQNPDERPTANEFAQKLKECESECDTPRLAV